jgi:hypothetical protein
LGPITKILPTLKRVRDEDAIIISIDDDIIYKKKLINDLVKNSIKYPNEVIGGIGYKFINEKSTKKARCFDVDTISEWWPAPYESKDSKYVDIIEGFGGIAYKKRLVDIPLLEKLNEVSYNCKFSDDLTISYVLAKYNVKRRNLKKLHFYPLNNGEEKGISKKKTPPNYTSYNRYKVVKCLDEIKKKDM